MEPVMKRIRIAQPYVVHPDTKQIYGFYQVMVKWPCGKRTKFDSEEHAKAAIDNRAVDQASVEAEFPAGIHEAILASRPKYHDPDPDREIIVEQDSFTVILIGLEDGSKKIPLIKAVRELTGKGLRESKELVTEVPQMVFEDVSKEVAAEAKVKLEAAGGKVEIK